MNDRMVMHNNEITQNNNQGQCHEQRLNQHFATTTALHAAPYRANSTAIQITNTAANETRQTMFEIIA